MLQSNFGLEFRFLGLRPWGLGYVLLSNVDPGSRDPNIQALTDEEFLDYGSTLAVLKVSVYILNAYNASARHETLNSKHPKPSPPRPKKKTYSANSSIPKAP